MKYPFFTFFLILCSFDLVAETFPSLVAMPKEYLATSGEIVEVRNMPEVRNQGGLPECHGFSAWYLYMQLQCKSAGEDCKNLDPKQVPSPVLMSAYGLSDDSEKELKIENLPEVIAFSTGGSASGLFSGIKNWQVDQLYADSCFPMDQFIRKFGGDNAKMNNALKNLKNDYFDKVKGGAKPCITCLLDTLRNEFDWQSDQARIKQALSKKSFDEFLFEIFVGKCKSKVSMTRKDAEFWPKSSGFYQTRSYDNYIRMLVGLLNNNIPVAGSFCVDKKYPYHNTNRCGDAHVAVITGYRKVCKGRACTEYLKILNSWGDAWQKANSDGWIDAPTFFDYMESIMWLSWRSRFELLAVLNGRKNIKDTIEILLPLANSGDAAAQYELAQLYNPQNQSEAAKWYLKAAELGYSRAQLKLGKLYIQGKGVTPNRNEAIRWLKKAAVEIDGANLELGLIYKGGKDVDADSKEAMKWFMVAANLGNEQAEFEIGLLYEQGMGVPINKAEAEKWYQLSAEHGYAPAQRLFKQRYLASVKAEVLPNKAENQNGTPVLDIPMVRIKPGEFVMGADRKYKEYNDQPAHKVTIKYAFEIGRTEVTQGQWKSVMGNNPSKFKQCGDDCPVESVNYDDIQKFLERLNNLTGRNFRLPSEAEWEYACRAGRNDEHCGGNDIENLGWFYDNSGNETSPVAKKRPNAWGIYDMTGNVREWVDDYYHKSYEGAPADGSAWKSNPYEIRSGGRTEALIAPFSYVMRGSSFSDDKEQSGVTERGAEAWSSGKQKKGFRLVRTLP